MRRTHGDLIACRLRPAEHRRTCGYWYTVQSGGMAHTAFGTREGLDLWLAERGLELDGDLREPGLCKIRGAYRTESHLVDDPDVVEKMEGHHTRDMSNGDYVVAVIVTDADSLRTVHTLNPNVKGRKVFDHGESRWMLGGGHTAIQVTHWCGDDKYRLTFALSDLSVAIAVCGWELAGKVRDKYRSWNEAFRKPLWDELERLEGLGHLDIPDDGGKWFREHAVKLET